MRYNPAGTTFSGSNRASQTVTNCTLLLLPTCRAGPKSLVLIDELGRATSTADGVALSWSMSEYLLALGAHVLLATHFRQLEELADIYPSCKLWRMQVQHAFQSPLAVVPGICNPRIQWCLTHEVHNLQRSVQWHLSNAVQDRNGCCRERQTAH